jgi:1,4-dihydroxy-2-naphthoate octaprenyltransferase
VRAWIRAARPATLPASIVPVIVGSAFAAGRGVFNPGVAALALATAMLIQIGTNLANDLSDADRGADGQDRLGPARAVASGWLSRRAVAYAAALAFVAAALLGVPLVLLGGWPILAIGLSGIAAGLAYTGGPAPLGYIGLGEVFVFLYFGLFAVAGTAILEAGLAAPAAWWAGTALGLLAAAILVVNNLRDRDGDRRANKRTLAARFGARFARIEYTALVAAAYLAIVAGVALGDGPRGWWLVLASTPLAGARIIEVWRRDGVALNAVLAGTARLEAAFGLLLALGSLR